MVLQMLKGDCVVFYIHPKDAIPNPCVMELGAAAEKKDEWLSAQKQLTTQ
ncbi:hypothetical protein GCM10023189_01540 [Nibrella saemangeumensis]|uniref:Uncharacterized protein n=1 Tax=Nibrella saemangeumensis TaxID=1084526 RepID=A0ABP8MA13_9BACT